MLIRKLAPITKKEFLRYLKRRKRAFRRRSGCDCPVAGFFKDKYGRTKDIYVGFDVRIAPKALTGGGRWRNPGYWMSLPQWTKRFIGEIDEHGKHFLGQHAWITPSAARKILMKVA